MKRFAGTALILLGLLLAIIGGLGTPAGQSLFPLTIPFAGDSHTYLRLVPEGPAPPPYAAPALICFGVIAMVVGARLRRRAAV